MNAFLRPAVHANHARTVPARCGAMRMAGLGGTFGAWLRDDDGEPDLQTRQSRLRGLRPLAVLPVEMSLLRLQQPCPRPGDRRGTLRPGLPRRTRASRQADEGAQRRLHLLWRRDALADEARHRRRHPRRHRRKLVDRAQRRGHAGGQPDQRRGQSLHRLPQGRRQPRLARRPGDERRRPQGARAPAHRRRGDEGGRHRRLDLRALLVRSHLRPPAADARGLASRSSSARSRARAITCPSTS